jgi:uncharacterized membrane protein (UPF0127 family)
MRHSDVKPLILTLALVLLASAGVTLTILSGPTTAQPTLPQERLTVTDSRGHNHVFQVEMATTPGEQEIGLMFRPSVPPTTGMLFIFPIVQPQSFWMEHTSVPLDMLFINANGVIRAIARHAVPYSLSPELSGGPVKAVLELQGGLTDKEDIHIGDRVLATQFQW